MRGINYLSITNAGAQTENKMKNNKISALAIICCICLFQVGLVCASPITVSASADTFITEHLGYGGPASTHETNNLVLVRGITGLHRTYPIIGFDLTSLEGRTVTGPTVDLVLDIRVGWSGNKVTQSVSVRESLTGWDEASASYANFGGVGFNEATHTGANLTTRNVTYNGVIEPITFSISSAVVQNWIDNPTSNNGLFLVSNTSALSRDIYFSSREYGTAPQLSFDLAPIPEPGVISLMAIFCGGVVFVRRFFPTV